MITVVSHANDIHAVEVLKKLGEMGARAVLFDTGQFPRDLILTVEQRGDAAWNVCAGLPGGPINMGEARVVWWRRPLPFELDTGLTDPEDRAFAYGECHAAISGMWSCLDAVWINDPDRDVIAARKLLQLKVAACLGLRTPRTLVTTDPAAAEAFITAEGSAGTIYKPFSATEKAWRETRLLGPAEHAQLASVTYAPVIFQEHIPAVADLRITMVADEVFAAEIVPKPTSYQYDFRMDMEDADIRPHRLPDDVADRLRSLMTRFGLVYGAIDMRLTPEGEYVFLEINPAGQWLFIELRTAQPITAALCRFMVAHDVEMPTAGGPR